MSPNFVRDMLHCFTWSQNHEEHHQSLMSRAWFFFTIKIRKLSRPGFVPLDWRTCVLSIRPPQLSYSTMKICWYNSARWFSSVGRCWQDLGIYFKAGDGSQELSLYCPYWMINKTGKTLAYKVSHVRARYPHMRYHMSEGDTRIRGIACHGEIPAYEVSHVTGRYPHTRYHMSEGDTRIQGITCHTEIPAYKVSHVTGTRRYPHTRNHMSQGDTHIQSITCQREIPAYEASHVTGRYPPARYHMSRGDTRIHGITAQREILAYKVSHVRGRYPHKRYHMSEGDTCIRGITCQREIPACSLLLTHLQFL